MVVLLGLATATFWCLSSIAVEAGDDMPKDIIADYAYLSYKVYYGAPWAKDKGASKGKSYVHDKSKCLENNGEGMKPDADCIDCSSPKKQACSDGYVMHPTPLGSCEKIICSPPARKSAQCFKLTTEGECLESKDSREPYRSDCVWNCVGRFRSGHRCEPKKWVEKQQEDYWHTAVAGSGRTCGAEPEVVWTEPRTLTNGVTGWKVKIVDVLKSPESKVWLVKSHPNMTSKNKRKECIVATMGSEKFNMDVNTFADRGNDLDNNFDWRNQDLPGTKYRVVKGYYTHITELLDWNYGCDIKKPNDLCNDDSRRRNRDVLNDFIEDCRKKNYEIALTGHSLGGSVSTLFAIAFDQGALGLPRLEVDRVVTYGQVRLVAKTGKDRCPSRLMDRSVAVRVVNTDSRSKSYDPATVLPLHWNIIGEEFCFESYMLDWNNRLAKKGHSFPKKDAVFNIPDPHKRLHHYKEYSERAGKWFKGDLEGWPNGRVCDPVFTCHYCNEPATMWTNYAGVTACGKQKCWGKGTKCATCGSCCNGWKWAFPLPVCK